MTERPDTRRAPTFYDYPVCRSCGREIHPGDPEVPSGGGWQCQTCAYLSSARR